MGKKIKNNPVITAATVSSIVAALLALLVQFGVPLEAGQTQAILTLVAVVAPVILGAIYARSKVDGPETRKRKERQRFGH